MHFTTGVIIKESEIKKLLGENQNKEAIFKAIQVLTSNTLFKYGQDYLDEKSKEMSKEDLLDLIDTKKEEGSIPQDMSVDDFIDHFYDGYILEDSGLYSLYNSEVRYDWYVIGGRWRNTIPLLEEDNNKNDDNKDNIDLIYENDINSFAKIKDIRFKAGPMSSDTLVKLEKEYEKMCEKEFFLKDYPTFNDYLEDATTFTTYSFVNSNGEWQDFYLNSPSDYINAIKKENSNDYFVLVDCHI